MGDTYCGSGRVDAIKHVHTKSDTHHEIGCKADAHAVAGLRKGQLVCALMDCRPELMLVLATT